MTPAKDAGRDSAALFFALDSVDHRDARAFEGGADPARPCGWVSPSHPTARITADAGSPPKTASSPPSTATGRQCHAHGHVSRLWRWKFLRRQPTWQHCRQTAP